jgi:hypothetical protein
MNYYVSKDILIITKNRNNRYLVQYVPIGLLEAHNDFLKRRRSPKKWQHFWLLFAEANLLHFSLNRHFESIICCKCFIMEQHALKNVNNCLYTNVYSYLETSGGISHHPYLNVVHFFNTRGN